MQRHQHPIQSAALAPACPLQWIHTSDSPLNQHPAAAPYTHLWQHNQAPCSGTVQLHQHGRNLTWYAKLGETVFFGPVLPSKRYINDMKNIDMVCVNFSETWDVRKHPSQNQTKRWWCEKCWPSMSHYVKFQMLTPPFPFQMFTAPSLLPNNMLTMWRELTC